MSGAARRVGAAAGSLGSCLVLFVAVPVALVVACRSRFGSASPFAGVAAPWEWEAGAIRDALAAPLGDDAVADVVIRSSVCVAWVALAVILVSTVAEVAHMVRHGGLPRPQVRGLGWAQPVARTIAVGILALLPTVQRATASTPMALSALAPSARSAPAELVDDMGVSPSVADGAVVSHRSGSGEHSSARAAATPSSSVRYHEVERGESVWSIASALAGGDDARTMEIADAILDANLGQVMTDGQRFTTPALIRPGWKLRLPERAAPASVLTAPVDRDDVGPGDANGGGDAPDDGHVIHVVEDGETLSGIAAEHLDDATEWPLVFEANAGATMADGRVFDDPNLIVPGWELRIPPAGSEPDDVEVDVIPPADVSESDALDDDVVQPVEDVEPDRTDVDVPLPADPVVLEPVPYDPPDPFVVGPLPASSDVEEPGDASTPVTTSPASTPVMPTTTTSTTVPVAADGGEAAGPSRPAVESPAAPSPIRLEHAAMLAAGVLALVGARRLHRLRRAMPRTRIPSAPPEIVDAERRLRAIDPGEGVARLDIALRSLGRQLVGTGTRIGLVRAAPDGRMTVRLTGDAELSAPWIGHGVEWELGAHVPIELLATDARSAGQPCHALVEIGRDERGDRVVVDLEAAGVLVVEARPNQADEIVRAIAAGLASSPHAEVAELVTASIGSDVLLGHPNAQSTTSPERALDVAMTARASVLDDGATTFDRRVWQTGGEMWEPTVVLLGSDDAAAEVLAEVGLPDPGRGVAVAAASGSDAIPGAGARIVAHADRWELIAFGECRVIEPIGLTGHDLGEITAILEEADVPAVAETASATVTSSTSDEPVDLPYEPPPHEVVVGLLGGVEIRSRSGELGTFERSKTVELIAWLATHRDRATRAAARTALWEIDVRDATFANVVSEARRALARLVPSPDGEEWVGRTLTESLPLHDLVVTDVDLVRHRLEHARSAAPSHAIDVLEPAVDLIREMPFAGTNYLWPDADGLTSDLVLLTTTVTAELAAHALSLGDTERVFRATGHGLRVLPGHEELIGLRMRAHARAGDLAGVRAEWESYERVIVGDAWSDGEPAPKLVELRHRLLSSGT